MKKIIPYITFICLTLSAATGSLPVVAGGCSGYNSKISEKKCDKDDTDCQIKKTEKIDLNEATQSWRMIRVNLLLNSAPRELTEFLFFVFVGFSAGSLGLI